METKYGPIGPIRILPHINIEKDVSHLIYLICQFTFFKRYSIGNSDLINGLEYGWLYTLARISKQPYTQLVLFKEDNRTITKIELRDGPSRKTMYVTALYYTMTCMTSVGFGNIAAETHLLGILGLTCYIEI